MKSTMIKADKARNLRYSTNALCKMEELSGKAISEMTDSPGMKDLRTMLFCGLYWEDKQLTEEKAGEIMDIILSRYGIDYLSEKLGQALDDATGTQKKK